MVFLQDVIDQLLGLNPPASSTVWIHEKVVCRLASIQHVEGMSTRDVLTEAIDCLARGYIIGQPKEHTPVSQGLVDLATANHLSIRFQIHGSKEEFSTAGHLNPKKKIQLFQPRWFCYGEPGTIGVKGQLKIARTVRKGGDVWKQWFLQNAVGVRSFQPTINTICETNGINESTIREILFCSNFHSGRTTRSMQCNLAQEHPSTQESSTQELSTNPTTPRARTPRTGNDGPAATNTPLSPALRKEDLLPSATSNMVDWEALDNLASIELIVSLAMDGKTEEEIAQIFRQQDLQLPSTISIADITTLSRRSLLNGWRNIKLVCQEQESFRNGIFIPQKEQLLVE